jgi:hypothetical protein
MSFRRTCQQNILLNESYGFSSAAMDLEFSFSLQQVLIYLGGVLVYTVAIPGAAEFVALFAEYRIKKASVRMFYNNNTSSLTTAATLSLPLVNVVFDPSDVSAVTLASVLQYPNCRTFQLGNGAEAPPCFSISPVVPVGAAGIGNAMLMSSPWLSTDQPAVQHFGMKIVYDPSNAVNTAIGSINFYFDIDFDCKVVN